MTTSTITFSILFSISLIINFPTDDFHLQRFQGCFMCYDCVEEFGTYMSNGCKIVHVVFIFIVFITSQQMYYYRKYLVNEKDSLRLTKDSLKTTLRFCELLSSKQHRDFWATRFKTAHQYMHVLDWKLWHTPYISHTMCERSWAMKT